MFSSIIVLQQLIGLIVLTIFTDNECYVEARVHIAKDYAKSYRSFIRHKRSKPNFADGSVEVQVQIPMTISFPPMKIKENELADQLGGAISDKLKKIVIERLLREFAGNVFNNEIIKLNKLSTDKFTDNDIAKKSFSKIPEGDNEAPATSLIFDSEKIDDKLLKYSRQRREAPSGVAMAKKDALLNKHKTKTNTEEDWGHRVGEESKRSSKVVLPDVQPSAMNSNNRVSEIVIEQFGTRKNSANDPLKLFLGHRFSSLFPSRPTRDSLYNSGNYQTFHSSQSYPPTSFDDLELGSNTNVELSQGLEIEKRLGKLDSIFRALSLDSEECRKKVTCEVSREATKYSPLAEIIQQETRLNSKLREMGRELLDSSDGTRLLGYIEASARGNDKYRQCDVYRFRCRKDVSQMIDMDSLVVWKEVVGWLTVKVLANGI